MPATHLTQRHYLCMFEQDQVYAKEKKYLFSIYLPFMEISNEDGKSMMNGILIASAEDALIHRNVGPKSAPLNVILV